MVEEGKIYASLKNPVVWFVAHSEKSLVNVSTVNGGKIVSE